jgi:hypothetical protein
LCPKRVCAPRAPSGNTGRDMSGVILVRSGTMKMRIEFSLHCPKIPVRVIRWIVIMIVVVFVLAARDYIGALRLLVR